MLPSVPKSSPRRSWPGRCRWVRRSPAVNLSKRTKPMVETDPVQSYSRTPRPFKRSRSDPQIAYDVVVIGAGIGGLLCANLIARGGLRVLLIEQHYVVGGYCSMFQRKGYTFDAA